MVFENSKSLQTLSGERLRFQLNDRYDQKRECAYFAYFAKTDFFPDSLKRIVNIIKIALCDQSQFFNLVRKYFSKDSSLKRNARTFLKLKSSLL